MGSKRRMIRRTAGVAAVLIFIGAVAAAWVWFDVSSWQRLDPARLTGLAQTGAIYDKDGAYVTTLVGKENRTVIAMDTLPDHVVNAFLAAEDLRFYKHPGFDVTRIFLSLIHI